MLQRMKRSSFCVSAYARRTERGGEREREREREMKREKVSPLCLITDGIYNHGCCSGGQLWNDSYREIDLLLVKYLASCIYMNGLEKNRAQCILRIFLKRCVYKSKFIMFRNLAFIYNANKIMTGEIFIPWICLRWFKIQNLRKFYCKSTIK